MNSISLDRETIERFWSKVRDTESRAQCWNWTAGRSNRYGAFSFRGMLIRAHRFSYILHFGAIPQGRCVCHRCDNTLCVNPAHLFIGTQADNVTDMIHKHRQAEPPLNRGSDNGMAKLDENKVSTIRSLYTTGRYSQQRLADLFNIDQTSISLIVRNKIWTEVSL